MFPSALAVWDVDGKIRRTNACFERLLGYSSGELEGRSIFDFAHPEDRAVATAEFRRAIAAGEAAGFESRARCKDGSYRWFVWSTSTLAGSELVYVGAYDITKRKLAEERARRSDESLRFTLDTAGIGLCQRESGETSASEQQFRLYGLEPAETWIAHEHWLQLIHPGDRERIEAERLVALEQSEPYDMQFRVVWPDGSIHWLLCRGRSVSDSRGAWKAEVTIDVTERKRAEAELEEFFNVCSAPIAIIGFDGYTKRVNAAVVRGSGFTAEEFARRSITEFFHPDDRAAMQAEFQRLSAQGGNAEFECRALARDGSVVWLVFSATAVPDEKAIFTVACDITESKRAEEALRESEEKFRELFDCAPVAYHELDLDGVVRRVNQAECSLLGYRASEILGRPIWEFVAAAEWDACRQAIRSRLLGQTPTKPVQRRFIRSDGAELCIEIHPSLVRDAAGGIVGVRSALVDVTERKRAEEALRESEEKFRELFDGAPVAYHELDLNGVVVGVNQAECTLLGYTASEILGRSAWEFLNAADQDAGHEAVRRKLSGKTSKEPVQYRFIRSDGAGLWVEVYSSLVRNAAGETVGLRTAILDITERKRMAEDLKAQAENLARSNTELERFAYVASHDLQEPLRMVASFTQLLARRYSGRLDEKADEYIHYAVDGAKRMQELINDLLAYSRVNTKDLELRPTDSEAAVRAALENLKAAIAESGAVVEWDPPLPVLKADALQLGQLFQNLIGNAIKFHGPEPPRIRISVAGDGAYWLFSVRDNGIGIDPRYADRIFQIFQRLHGRSEYPGTGIGLAVCQKVVERHGGRIWVESQPGAGADFRFTLPKPPTES